MTGWRSVWHLQLCTVFCWLFQFLLILFWRSSIYLRTYGKEDIMSGPPHSAVLSFRQAGLCDLSPLLTWTPLVPRLLLLPSHSSTLKESICFQSCNLLNSFNIWYEIQWAVSCRDCLSHLSLSWGGGGGARRKCSVQVPMCPSLISLLSHIK